MSAAAFLGIQISDQTWGVDIAYLVEVASLSEELRNSESFHSRRFYVENRVIPLADVSRLFGILSNTDSVSRNFPSKVVVIRREPIWLGLVVDQVLGVLQVDAAPGPWAYSYLPFGVRRDLIQGVGKATDGRVMILMNLETVISLWQEQETGPEAFPLPPPPRLGGVKFRGDSGDSYPGPERRGHLRLDRTEQVLIRKSRQSGYPAYQMIISFEKDLNEDPSRMSRALALLQEMGTIIRSDVIYKSGTLGRAGRHLGLFYLTEHSSDLVLNRLRELEEVDRAQLFSFEE